MRPTTIEDIKALVRTAAVRHTTGTYKTHYIGELQPWITVRAPAGHQTRYTRLFTHDYEQLVSCSSSVARRHLRLLVSDGFLRENKTAGGCTSWYFTDEAERVAIGQRVIKRLQAQGLRFLDEDER